MQESLLDVHLVQFHVIGDCNGHHDAGDCKTWGGREVVDKVYPLLHLKASNTHACFEAICFACLGGPFDLVHILACEDTIIWQQVRLVPPLKHAFLPEASPLVSFRLEPKGLESWVSHGYTTMDWISFKQVYFRPDAVVIWCKGGRDLFADLLHDLLV